MKLLLLFMLVGLFSACKKNSVNCGRDCGTLSEELLFQTGFNQTTISDGPYKNANFSGTDPDLAMLSHWNDFKEHPQIGFVEIGYEDGAEHQRQASIVDDPDSVGNSVLKFQLIEPHINEGSRRKGRIQLSVHDNNCIKELYQHVRLKLHPDLEHFEQRSDRLFWFTLFEFWNNGAWTGEKFPFRVTVNFYKEEGVGSPINFRVKSDYQDCDVCQWVEVWGETATSFPVVYGEWMDIELYLKEGDSNNGRFYMTVTPENGSKTVLFDLHNTTQHPKETCPDGFTHFETMKVYTSGENIDYMRNANKELSLYWDDWKFFVNKQP